MMETIEIYLVPIDKEYIAKTYSMVSRLSIWAKDNDYPQSGINSLNEAQVVLINWYADYVGVL